MRAWQVVSPGPVAEALRMAELPRRDPGAGEVEVRVEAVGLGFPDYLLARGRYHDRPATPFVVGTEAAGVVTTVGAGVTDAATGDRVIVVPGDSGPDACAEYLTVPAERLLPVPAQMPMTEAAVLFVAYQTAHMALFRRAQLAAGEVLLVQAAAGGIGSAAVQLGKAAGARVIAVAGGPAKADLCRRLGADLVVDHHVDDFVEQVRAFTGERGVDVAFEPVGGEVFHRTRRCMAVEGRLLAVGFASGDVPSAPVNHLLLKNYAVVGFRTRPFRLDPDYRRRIHDDVLALYRAGQVTPPVTPVPFEEVPEALARIGSGAVAGRLCADLSPGRRRRG